MLIGAADEVLAELKNEKTKDLAKRAEVESMLGKLRDAQYHLLCNLSKESFLNFGNKTQKITFFQRVFTKKSP